MKVEDHHGSALEGAEVIWHLGFGLGQAKTRTGSNGKASIYAPKGLLLALEAKASSCSSDLGVHEASHDAKMTLTCN